MWRVAGLLFFCVSASFLFSANGETHKDDVAALKDFFNNLNSPSQLKGWSPNGGDPCGEKWQGVTCEGNRVAKIKLSGLGLAGSVQGYVLQKLNSLTVLVLSNNNIGGTLPYAFPRNLWRLDLSGNAFTGNIPWIPDMSSLEYLSLSRNQLQGNVNDMFSNFSSLSTMDLSTNSFSGNLPQSFSSLSSLSTLYLQNNQFTGSIDVLADLPLQNLNVANNRFTGWIPDRLKHIKSFQSDGDSWSTGPAPPPPPGQETKPTQVSENGGGKSGIGGGGIAGILISLLVVGLVVAFFIIRKKPELFSNMIRPKGQSRALFTPEPKPKENFLDSSPVTLQPPLRLGVKPPPVDQFRPFDEKDRSYILNKKKTSKIPVNATAYSIADLQLATGSFCVDNLLGEGSIGCVYRAQFDDGKVLAVKKIYSSVFPNQSSGDFMEVVSCVSQLHHPNVTKLVGYCSEHGQHLLVYEFHRNGSLYDFLYLSDEYNKPLTWNIRVKTALATARALEYLHEVCSPPIVHKNFKSTNILLDTELNPHISECGLSNLITKVEHQALDQYFDSGYCAPEVAMSGQYTLKSDVFSFGVVMLELLTGRMPFDSSRLRPEQSLVRWASPQLHDIDALDRMVDPALRGLYPAKSLSGFADIIAQCIQTEPGFRPHMSDVVQQLVRLVQRADMNKRMGSGCGVPEYADDLYQDMF